MATYNQNGRDAHPDDNRSSWRPHDQPSSQGRYHGNEDDRDLHSFRDRNQEHDRYGSNRDPRRWEGSRGSEVGYYEDRDSFARATEYYGQGQSGYSAGRRGDDRSQRWQNRNEMSSSPGRFEDRRQSLGVDDRFTGRGDRGGYWEDQPSESPERYGAQGGYGGGRGFESNRSGWRGYDERMGYQGSYGPSGYGPGGYGPGGYGASPYRQSMGYQGGYGPDSYGPGDYRLMGFHEGGSPERSFSSYGEPQRQRDSHRHSGQGPHRGKGPVGYQRSDERLREMISESLADDDQIDASQIEVTVKNGEVTLIGTVEDRQTKREAEECACSVSGVRDLQNQLRVRDERNDGRQAGKGGASSQSTYTSGKTESETFSQDKKPRA